MAPTRTSARKNAFNGTVIKPFQTHNMAYKCFIHNKTPKLSIILLTSDLNWSAHYSLLLMNAYKTLGLLRRTFSDVRCVRAKKILYLSLVRSKLQYCWRPMLIKDIISLECVQRRATKYILHDFSSDYKSHLISLNILPLMMQLEINDLMFFIKNLKDPISTFNVHQFVQFCS